LTQDFRHTKGFQEHVEEQTLSTRIGVLWWIFTAVLVAYLGAFWYLQVVQTDKYRTMADENRVRHLDVPAPRGALLDRNGQVIVRNRLSFSVVLDREKGRDLPREFALLSPIMRRTTQEIASLYYREAARRFKYEPIVLAEDVDLGTVSYVEARRSELSGVSIGIDDRRYYEGGASGAHLVGYVGEVSANDLATGRVPDARRGDFVGKAGLERYFDASLRGRHGYRDVIVNSVGREVGELPSGNLPQPGENIRTSIDLEMQRRLDLSFGDRAGAAVFLDTHTGEILALTSRPGYDSNLFVTGLNRTVWRALIGDPGHPLQNRASQSAYSPGSTFKMIVAAAALEAGVIDPSTTFFCPGQAEFYGRVFHCHDKKGHGNVDLNTAIIKSCDVFFYNVGKRLGIEKISAMAHRFGLGSPTGLGLGTEEPGLVPDEAWKQRVYHDRWYPSETISVSIGQGPILVTPIQQAIVEAAIATDGRLVSPTFRLGGEMGTGSLPQPHGETLSGSTLAVIRRAMWGVVHEAGTGTKALISGFDICAKTGTVQVVAASVGVKNEMELAPEQRDHAWFVGFAPYSSPEIAFAILVEHGGHGGDVAAPIAKDVLQIYYDRTRKAPGPPAPTTEVAVGPAGAATRSF